MFCENFINGIDVDGLGVDQKAVHVEDTGADRRESRNLVNFQFELVEDIDFLETTYSV